MTIETRDSIQRAISEHGFEIKTKANGRDLYQKLVTLHHPSLKTNIYIDKSRGISKAGEIKYLKVALHPDFYLEKLEYLLDGVTSAINARTKVNLHSHSGYEGFPYYENNNEPVAKAYKVKDLNSLSELLSRYIGINAV